MFNSVKIDNKDLYEEYGLILASKEIGQPEAQSKYINIPMRDGALDITEVLADAVKYKNRTIKMTFLYMGNDKAEAISKVASAIHGKRLRIDFDEDPAFYYLGRISVDSANDYSKASKISISAECDPFKYDVNASDIDWKWDTFDLEDGIINEAGELVVNGELEFTLICRMKREFPVFVLSNPMTLTYNDVTYNLSAGSQKVYNLFFEEGENVLKFTGEGAVTISYVGGSL